MRVRIAAVAAAALAAVAAAGVGQASVTAPPARALADAAPPVVSPYGPFDGDPIESAPPSSLAGPFDGPLGD